MSRKEEPTILARDVSPSKTVRTRPTQGDWVLIRDMDPTRPVSAQKPSEHALNSDPDTEEDDEPLYFNTKDEDFTSPELRVRIRKSFAHSHIQTEADQQPAGMSRVGMDKSTSLNSAPSFAEPRSSVKRYVDPAYTADDQTSLSYRDGRRHSLRVDESSGRLARLARPAHPILRSPSPPQPPVPLQQDLQLRDVLADDYVLWGDEPPHRTSRAARFSAERADDRAKARAEMLFAEKEKERAMARKAVRRIKEETRTQQEKKDLEHKKARDREKEIPIRPAFQDHCPPPREIRYEYSTGCSSYDVSNDIEPERSRPDYHDASQITPRDKEYAEHAAVRQQEMILARAEARMRDEESDSSVESKDTPPNTQVDRPSKFDNLFEDLIPYAALMQPAALASSATPREPDTSTTCTNCFVQTTRLRRHDSEGRLLCDECGLFPELHGVVRPLGLEIDVIKKRNVGLARVEYPAPGQTTPPVGCPLRPLDPINAPGSSTPTVQVQMSPESSSGILNVLADSPKTSLLALERDVGITTSIPEHEIGSMSLKVQTMLLENRRRFSDLVTTSPISQDEVAKLIQDLLWSFVAEMRCPDRPLDIDTRLDASVTDYDEDHPDWDNSDSVSGPSSYAASIASDFSVASLASSASDISRGSGYSAVQIATATKVLLAIFYEDARLLSLYKSAIENQAIGAARLQRNLRRLFRAYASLLVGEATERLEYLASRLVLVKSAMLAQSIVEKLQNGRAALPLSRKERNEESSDEEEDSADVRPVNEDAFEDLAIFREFLVESEAFKTFRVQLQAFIVPKSTHLTHLESARSGDTANAAIVEAIAGQEMTSTWQNWGNDSEKSTGGFLGDAYGKTTARSVLLRMTDAFMSATDDFMIAAGLLEPLRPDTVRLRWRCVCSPVGLKVPQVCSNAKFVAGMRRVPSQRRCGASQRRHRRTR